MMDGNNAIGLTLALCSVVLTNISLLIQKHSSHVESGKPLHKRWRFIIGFILNTGSEICLSAPASLFAPLALLAPLGGVAVVVNALLTRFGCVCGIKEKLTFVEWLATFSIMSGVALVAFSGPGGDTKVVLDDLPAQFSQAIFLTFLVLGLLSVVMALLFFPPCDCAVTSFARRTRPSEGSPFRTVLSGFTAATCGAFSVLALKITLFTIVEWVAGRIDGPPPLSITCFVVLLTCAPLQLYLLNLSLATGTATFSIPLYLSLLMLFISFLGGILFHEFGSLLRDPYPLFLVLYLAGCLMVLIGLAVLSYKQQKRQGATAVVMEPQKLPEPTKRETAISRSTTVSSEMSLLTVLTESPSSEPSSTKAAPALSVPQTDLECGQ